MTIYRREAENAEEIAKLLRERGRTVITAPARCGKTTELLRYAESRYPNGRFAVVAKEENHAYIIRLHWCIHNGISVADVVAARLLGKELEGEDVNPPILFTPQITEFRTFNPSTPTFCDGWNSIFTEAQQKVILRRRLFIAAVDTETGENNASS